VEIGKNSLPLAKEINPLEITKKSKRVTNTRKWNKKKTVFPRLLKNRKKHL
jgi:hypothetical protein